jgi:hypothetical protein
MAAGESTSSSSGGSWWQRLVRDVGEMFDFGGDDTTASVAPPKKAGGTVFAADSPLYLPPPEPTGALATLDAMFRQKDTIAMDTVKDRQLCEKAAQPPSQRVPLPTQQISREMVLHAVG